MHPAALLLRKAGKTETFVNFISWSGIDHLLSPCLSLILGLRACAREVLKFTIFLENNKA
jgi:hypothetical protein